jgi:hypothetical protein
MEVKEREIVAVEAVEAVEADPENDIHAVEAVAAVAGKDAVLVEVIVKGQIVQFEQLERVVTAGNYDIYEVEFDADNVPSLSKVTQSGTVTETTERPVFQNAAGDVVA